MSPIDVDRLPKQSTLVELAGVVDGMSVGASDVVVVPLEVSTCADNRVFITIAVGSMSDEASIALASTYNSGAMDSMVRMADEKGREVVLLPPFVTESDRMVTYEQADPIRLQTTTPNVFWYIVRGQAISAWPLEDLKYTSTVTSFGPVIEDPTKNHLYLTLQSTRLRNGCP